MKEQNLSTNKTTNGIVVELTKADFAPVQMPKLRNTREITPDLNNKIETICKQLGCDAGTLVIKLLEKIQVV